jgi:hypothetical protein
LLLPLLLLPTLLAGLLALLALPAPRLLLVAAALLRRLLAGALTPTAAGLAGLLHRRLTWLLAGVLTLTRLLTPSTAALLGLLAGLAALCGRLLAGALTPTATALAGLLTPAALTLLCPRLSPRLPARLPRTPRPLWRRRHSCSLEPTNRARN